MTSGVQKNTADVKQYLFRIHMLEIDPEIWRRFVVPADISLAKFHEALQVVMGWGNDHAYAFNIKRVDYLGYPDSGFANGQVGKGASDVKLSDVVKRKGSAIYYNYDFGDNWWHQLKLENSNYHPASPDEQRFVCLDGDRACPPEDVGGTWGYDSFCKKQEKWRDAKGEIKNPDPDDWYADYDPLIFSLDEINNRLAEILWLV